jgi:methylphosphotriester-DNA--protein-cysteine methyltransferase
MLVVLGLLSSENAQRVAGELPQLCELRYFTGVEPWLKELSACSSQALLIDPKAVRPEQLHAVVDAVSTTLARVLVYADVDRWGAECVLALSARVGVQCVLRGCEDERLGLARQLGAGFRPTASAILLHRVAERVRNLPPAIQQRAVGLLAGRRPVTTERPFAGPARSRRTLERWFSQAGLCSSARFVAATRLAHTWERLVDGLPLHDVATEVGYRSPRTMMQQFRSILGVSPRRASRSLTVVSFVERLTIAMYG